ncbi:phosphoglycerate kinase [Peptoniphilus asaccharolyticus DSM 20463]|uniref:Phosphoglycerate kinase n=1 Tax=Peptoniphilus asaccharolyticus DSM 20463 TaxID=573058 RepID=A0A1W1VJ87_PEPAS|nr:phosphoglycerate kinase [Peptoniphilus asaccharolyticus]MBL7574396.1 phosphoglycerate kinase [Peptoniphilus asaccharolyticus]SMB93439.1 phosphoglycerate kinase [Peptoniphilus asaccharolyticus DSM 20463]
MKKTIKDLDLKGKRAVIRVDYNVPLKDGKVTNDARVRASLETINAVLDAGASVVLLSHLGRPKGKYVEEFSLKPVVEVLENLIGKKVKFIADEAVVSDKVLEEVRALKAGEIALLENTRFVAGEEKNEAEFAKKLASLGDVYINDAFGTAHRAHASNVGIAQNLPSAMGYLVEKEVKYIKNAIENPKRPFVAILGGAKVSDKIGVIDNLLGIVDKIIIVGAMANTFVKSMGNEVGKSLVEDDKLELAKELIERAKENKVEMILPVDFVVAEELKEGVATEVVAADGIPTDKAAFDIGPDSVKKIEEALKDAATVIWNGPCGVFEIDEFAKGTFAVAEALANLEDAITIVGGGDSGAAVEKSGVEDKISHVSTGGGASLEMLEGKVLPGIDIIEEA